MKEQAMNVEDHRKPSAGPHTNDACRKSSSDRSVRTVNEQTQALRQRGSMFASNRGQSEVGDPGSKSGSPDTALDMPPQLRCQVTQDTYPHHSSSTPCSPRAEKRTSNEEQQPRQRGSRTSSQDSSTESTRPPSTRNQSEAIYDTSDETLIQDQFRLMKSFEKPPLLRTASRTYDLHDPETVREQQAILAQINQMSPSSAGKALSKMTTNRPVETSSPPEKSRFHDSFPTSAAASSQPGATFVRCNRSDSEIHYHHKKKGAAEYYSKRRNSETKDVNMEMFDGKNVRIHSANIVRKAMAENNAVKVKCFGCFGFSLVQKDAKVLYCSMCHSLSPIDSDSKQAMEMSDRRRAGQGARRDQDADAVVAKKLAEYRSDMNN